MNKRLESILSYPIAKEPAYGVPVPVTEVVYWLRLPLPFALNHINLWLIDKGNSWALVDTGCSTRITRTVLDGLLENEFQQKPIDQIIITHFHPDHIGLARFLANHFNCETWMTLETQKMLMSLLTANTTDRDGNIRRFYTQHGVQTPEPFIEYCIGKTYRAIVSGMPDDVNIIEDQTVIKIGEHHWRAIVTGGHAVGHTSLYCDELKLLISGDQILPEITSNISVQAQITAEYPLQLYMDSFSKFSEIQHEVLVLPSHGKVFQGIKERIMEIKLHHNKMLEKVMDICEQPVTAAESVPKLFQGKLDSLNNIFAFGESLAHLEHLANNGQLQRHKDNGVIRFLQP